MHDRLRNLFVLVCASALLGNWPAPATALEIIAEADVLVVQGGAINHQLRAQFEPLVKVELSFAIRACKLEGEQRDKLIAAGNAWLTKYVNDLPQNQRQNVRALRIVQGRVAQAGMSAEPNIAIPKGIASVVKEVLSPVQVAHYERECRQREQFHHEAVAAMLVSRMDEKLALSAEQRKKLAESIVDGWSDQWAPQPELFMYNQNIWPAIPDKTVSAHLTPAQWEIWTRLNKTNQRIHFGGAFANGEHVIDDVELKQPDAEPAAQPVEGIFVPLPAITR